jgi:hypothetical protein
LKFFLFFFLHYYNLLLSKPDLMNLKLKLFNNSEKVINAK